MHLIIGNDARQRRKIGKLHARLVAGGLQRMVTGLLRLFIVGAVADHARKALLLQGFNVLWQELAGHLEAGGEWLEVHGFPVVAVGR